MSMDEKQLANIQHELFKHATESGGNRFKRFYIAD